jgi:Flp pilus assembly protein TadG
MKKLNKSGTVSFEFIMVAVPFFILMFTIFDLGRYAITQQSLRLLADAGARAMMINCYSGLAIQSKSPSTCTSPSDPLTNTAKQAVAPFLFNGGLTPTLAVTPGTNALIVKASQPGLAMLMPIFGTTLNAPSASTKVPY